MPKAAVDFRTQSFDTAKVNAAGKIVGSRVYWKLYAIENLVRVVIHSVLSVKLGKDWWQTAADTDLQKVVAKRKQSYGNRPWHSTPGKHEVYYVYLSDLTKILTTHSGLFIRHIPDVDEWTVRLELIRLPRNIVGHMNWLTDTDRDRINVCHFDMQQLVAKLAATSSLPLLIP